MAREWPKRHDVITLGTDLPEEDQVNVEIVAIDELDPTCPVFTVYDAKNDVVSVIRINEDFHFAWVQFEPEKEPWQA